MPQPLGTQTTNKKNLRDFSKNNHNNEEFKKKITSVGMGERKVSL